MNDMSRHDLKQNVLAEYVGIAVAWVEANRNSFYAMVATIAGVLLFGFFFYSRLDSARISRCGAGGCGRHDAPNGPGNAGTAGRLPARRRVWRPRF